MKPPFSGRPGIAAATLAVVAVAMRLNNAFRYPPDWGFDASYNWRYIYRMARDWALPHPSAGWSTADPPLFFTVSAALMAVSNFAVVLVPLFNTALGLGIAVLAFVLVREAQPERPLRALLAGWLLLFLPAHVHMSAMVSEEMLTAFFASLTVFLLARRGRDPQAPGLRRAAGVGLASGLAVLTKLTGATAGVVAAATYALDGIRSATARSAVARIAVVAAVVAGLSGWFYARNLLIYGALQPFGLPAHQIMFDMPPGERGLIDFVWIPLATWTHPNLLDPHLLHSVWGGTYASVWFDAHRYFLPRDSETVTRLGTACLLLALLPTAAFAVGLAGGLRRSLRDPLAPDTPQLLLVAVTLAGYAVYNWQNPWFAVVKGTSLLGLSLPFAYYASDALDRWLQRGGARALLTWAGLAALTAAVVLSCSFNLAFEKAEVSGLEWRVPEVR